MLWQQQLNHSRCMAIKGWLNTTNTLWFNGKLSEVTIQQIAYRNIKAFTANQQITPDARCVCRVVSLQQMNCFFFSHFHYCKYFICFEHCVCLHAETWKMLLLETEIRRKNLFRAKLYLSTFSLHMFVAKQVLFNSVLLT